MANSDTGEASRGSYLWDFLRALLLVEFLLLATWNRTGYSYVSWIRAAGEFTAPMAAAGLALLIAHIALLRMSFVALGYAGILAALILLGCVLLGVSTLGLINLEQLSRNSDFWTFVVATTLSAGLSWGKFQQRLTGQRDVLKNPP